MVQKAISFVDLPLWSVPKLIKKPGYFKHF